MVVWLMMLWLRLDSYYYLSYLPIDNAVDKLKQLGIGALLYKIDMAFSHIRIDPEDLKHDSYYLD